MSSDSANRPQSETTSASIHDVPEQARLDDAMRRADELLVTSLKTDERQRRRRKIIGASILGLGLLAIAGSIWHFFGAAVNKPITPSKDQIRAAQLVEDAGEQTRRLTTNEQLDKYKEAVYLDPQNVKAWNGLGRTQFYSGNLDAALAAYDKSMQLEPNNTDAMIGLGKMNLYTGDYVGAEKKLLDAEKRLPGSAVTDLIDLYFVLRDFDEAAKWAQKLSGDSDATKFYTQAAQQAARIKTLVGPSMREWINRLSLPLPEHLPKDVLKGWLLLKFNDKNCREIFDNVRENRSQRDDKPQDAEALSGLGWFFLFDGMRPSVAPNVLDGNSANRIRQYFQRALKADPKSASAWDGLGRTQRNQQDLDGAIKTYEEMLATLPGNERGMIGLADAYMIKQEFQKAVPLLEQLTKLRPRDQHVQDQLAQAREKLSEAKAEKKDKDEAKQ